MKIVFVDNFDSFTYNLVEYVSETRVDGVTPETAVLKNTASLANLRAESPDGIVVSPGPGHPSKDRDVGVSNAVFRELAPEIPTLGVCLGLEAAIHVYGGEIGPAPEPVHGKAYPINHDGTGLFRGLDQGFRAGRYHSLSAVSIPSSFEVSAWTDHDGTRVPMGVRHESRPIFGLQFHPESVLTANGHDIIERFLGLAADQGQSVAAEHIHPD